MPEQAVLTQIRQLINIFTAIYCLHILKAFQYCKMSKNLGFTVHCICSYISSLYRYPNVLILTTSNVTGAIDLAFVDRADIKQYIGPPTPPAIYSIYRSCILELIKVIDL